MQTTADDQLAASVGDRLTDPWTAAEHLERIDHAGWAFIQLCVLARVVKDALDIQDYLVRKNDRAQGFSAR